MNKLIVFGGTFNPLTYAHAEVIELAKTYFNEEKVVILPSSDKFFYTWKNYDESSVLPTSLRLDILKEYSKRSNNILSLIEVEGKTFKTYDSLNELKKEFNKKECYFLLGSEKIKEIESWYNSNKLINENYFVFLKRNNDDMDKLINESEFIKSHLDRCIFIKDTLSKYQDCSSTKLRELIKNDDYTNAKNMTYDYILEMIRNDKNGNKE